MLKKVTKFHAVAVDIDDNLEAVVLCDVEYVAPSDSLVYAKEAMRRTGFDVPRGTKVKVEEIETAMYECTLDEFMSVARKVER